MRNLVLLAHPAPESLSPFSRKLEAAGFHVITAGTGAEAMAAVLQYGPQMVVTRADLPELEGTEVCLRLKQDATTDHIAVILITPEQSAGNSFVGTQVGADALLTEPIDHDALCTRISEMFRTLQLNAKALARRM